LSSPSEAITNYRIPLVGPEAPVRAWQEASRNHIWSARRSADAAPLAVLELLPEGLVRLPDRDRLFHIIAAGRPHRIEHAFGFWRTCGADALYVKSVYEAGVAYMMVISTAPQSYESDTIHWTCLSCGHELRTVEIPTRRLHLRGLLDRSLAAVRAFNASAAERTCSACGTIHPLAYGFEPEEDNDEERTARAAR
jgi:RNase P subunit RPR2